MGNCQAAEAAQVLIQLPGNKVERIYWCVSAQEVMSSNPGYYVAIVVSSSPTTKRLKVLRPGDTLLLGQVYRLISYHDVLKECAEKKGFKIGKLVKPSGGLTNPIKDRTQETKNCPVSKVQESNRLGRKSTNVSGGGTSGGERVTGRHRGGGARQWKPALQSISESGA